MTFQPGSLVIKNPATWQPSEFDGWGAGVGVGIVVHPPFEMDDGTVDVVWPAGRCFQEVGELLEAPEGVGINHDQYQKWLKNWDQHEATQAIRAALANIIKPEYIDEWLGTPNPAFDGLPPREVIARGDGARVWRMIGMMGEGMPT